MESRILQLISALRAAGVRISVAESAEAFRAVEILGIAQREQLRLSLSSTLVKDRRDQPVFARLFPLFFGSGQPPPLREDLSDELTPEEARTLAEALLRLPERLRANMERLISGERVREDELENLGRMAGLGRSDDLRYQNSLTERLLRAMGLPQVQQALDQLLDELVGMGIGSVPAEQIARTMQENLRAIR